MFADERKRFVFLKIIIKLHQILELRSEKAVETFLSWFAMNTHVDKTQEKKPQSDSNSESKVMGGETTFQFVDNRPEAIAQRKLQDAANNSPQVKQFRALQEGVNKSPQVQQAAHWKAIMNGGTAAAPLQQKSADGITPSNEGQGEREPLQGKFATVQRKESASGSESGDEKPVQRVDTLKSSDAQTTAGKDNKVDKSIKVAADDTKSPTKHPMYPTFEARIKSLFSQFPAPEGVEVSVLTRNIWTQICESVDSSSPELERTAGNTTYSNVAKGYVNMDSPGYKRALSEFDKVMGTLKAATNAQFVKANSFGFWSKPEGRQFAEEMTDLTLETSGIGSLFDGMPSLNAHQNGWDVQLWGSLSQAFGQAVAKEMQVKGKSVHVCAGGGTDKSNIFGAVESKALQLGANALGKSLEDAVTFHSVAAISKSNRKVDHSVKEGSMGLPGTWYSGHSWDESLRIGKERFDQLQP